MLRSLVSAACVLILSGCGGSDVPLAPVTGTVTHNGEPLPEAIVTFTPVAGGRPSVGETRQDGSYTLLFKVGEEGAMVGDHVVRVERAVLDPADDNIPEGQEDQTNVLPEAATDGSIQKTVTDDSNVIDIAL